MSLINFRINAKVAYVAINIAVGCVGFLKAFVFMTYFNFTELGIITLLNTTIMLVSLFQLGLLNGGYRIYSLGNTEENENINNTINTYFLIVASALLLYVLSSYVFQFKINPVYVIIGGFTGITTLSKNWLTNMLIAKSQLRDLNVLNVLTNGISVLFLLSVPLFGFIGALTVIVVPPLLFLTIALIKFKELRPTALSFKIKHIRFILISGFIPFVAGIFDQVNIQVQNWSIKWVLTEELLGKFYLVPLYILLFMLLPKSLNNLFFPKAMKLYNQREYEALRVHLKKYYISLFLYLIPAVLLTLYVMEPMVGWVFPEHLIGVQYVYIILPGMVAVLLSAPIGLIYNASIKLKPMLLIYAFTVLINSVFIYHFWSTDKFNLENIAILKSGLGIFILIFYHISYMVVKKKIWI
ncbi:hypothetical protein N9Y10_00840 [Flavobacteriaceae bacterium]|nr:hypothetical protein [Flavobacteriaceae bacterium]